MSGGDQTIENYKMAGMLCNNTQNLSASSQQNRVRRPPNSFILFSKDNRKSMQSLHPSYSNTEISRLLGEQWKNADSKIKEEYRQKSKQLSTIHKICYPDYVYSPTEARKRKAARVLSRLIPTSKPRSCKQSVLQTSQDQDAISNALDVLSYKSFIVPTASKVEEPSPWQIIEFKLESENVYPCCISTEVDVETCSTEIYDMKQDYAISDLNETGDSDKTTKLIIEELVGSDKIDENSVISESVDDNEYMDITSISDVTEPVDLSIKTAATGHEFETVGTSVAQENEVIGSDHGDTLFRIHDIEYSPFPTHPSATVGAHRVQPFPYYVPTPIFDAKTPFYPRASTPREYYYSPQRTSSMPNSAYPISPFQANARPLACLPSFAAAFGYSRPLCSSFQAAAPHYNMHISDYVPPYPFQPTSQAVMQHLNMSHSKHVAMAAGLHMPSLSYGSSPQAVAPRHGLHFSDYVPAEASMPPEALIPPNYYQPENIPPYSYSARIPTVMHNENPSAESGDRSKNSSHSVGVTQSGREN